MRSFAAFLTPAALLAMSGCGFFSHSALSPESPKDKVYEVRRSGSGQTVIPVSVGGRIRHRMAVVVGISKYAHQGAGQLWNLRYAAADADAFAAHLLNSGFNHVKLLTDEGAALAQVRQAIHELIQKACEDDLVLIFWAGHGCPDLKTPGKHYLIAHDTDPEKMSRQTAYAMDELRDSLDRLRAHRLMVLVDTCHAGGISDPTLFRGDQQNSILSALRGVYVGEQGHAAKPDGRAPQMRLVFTACEQREVSQESGALGGGHGVFTHFLLNALQGEADKAECRGNGDNVVVLDELIEFTRDRVRSFTKGAQNPAAAGNYDRQMPIGLASR